MRKKKDENLDDQLDAIMFKSMLAKGKENECTYCGGNVTEQAKQYTSRQKTQYLLTGLCISCYRILILGEENDTADKES